MDKTQSVGALEGLRVLDLSRVLAGPWASQLLADLGADVVKVERPQIGDDTRAWGPPWLPDADGDATGESAYYLCANRNKRSVTVDMSHPDGQAVIKRLAAEADVLIENFKVGGLAQYGLDYATLKELNPRLIYCSITGFGQVGVALTDVMTGLYAAVGVLAALARRERTGEGQQVDLSLLDVQIASLANQASSYLVGASVPRRLGNAHPNIVPYQEFPTADGHMIIAVGNDGQFRHCCEVLGRPEWASDGRFLTNPQRVKHRTELVAMMEAATRQRTTREWVGAMEAAGVPCGPINNLADVFADPHVQARNVRIKMRHSLGSDVAMVGNPIRFSESPVQYRNAPPTLGEHTDDVLVDWLRMVGSEVDALRKAKVL